MNERRERMAKEKMESVGVKRLCQREMRGKEDRKNKGEEKGREREREG